MDETTRAGRLRSALEAACTALEVAADPANDIDCDGFATLADICRATLKETHPNGEPVGIDETQDDGSASLCEGCRRDETCLGGNCSSNACPSGARAE